MGEVVDDHPPMAKDPNPPPKCDHICLRDDGHVERGEPHFHGYEIPSPRRIPSTERKVLVGRSYAHMATTWNEWSNTFEDCCEDMAKRREDQKANTAADEIIEVLVVRRARVTADITVTEVPVLGVVDGGSEAGRGQP